MVRIKINNTFLELERDFQIALNLSVGDIAELQSRAGNHTYSIQIPWTNNNAKAFNFVATNNIDFKGSKKVDAEIYQGQNRVLKGFIIVKSYSEKILKAVFYSGNSFWIDALGQLKLTDIDFSELEHLWNEDSILNSLSNGWEDGYTYPFINYNDKSNTSSTEFTAKQFRPCMFAKYLLNRIFNDIYIIPKGQVLSNPVFEKMILASSKIDESSFKPVKYNFLGKPIGSSDVISTESEKKWIYDPQDLGVFDIKYKYFNEKTTGYTTTLMNASDGRYTAQTRINVRIKAESIKWRNAGNFVGDSYYKYIAAYSISVRRNGTEIIDSQVINEVITLDAGDYIEVFTKNNSDVYSILFNPNENFLVNYLDISLDSPVTGTAITPASFIPDMTQLEFVKDIMLMFGLQADYNETTRAIDFFSYEEVMLNEAVDWSNKIDGKPSFDYTALTSRYSQVNNLKWSEDDKDLVLEAYKAANNKGVGEGFIIIDDDSLKKESDLITLKASPTYGEFTQNWNGLNIPFIPEEGKYRYLLVNQNVDTIDVLGVANISIEGENTTKVNYAFFDDLSHLNNEFYESLSFEEKFNRSSLKENYRVLENILNNGYIMKVNVFLKPQDITSIDFKRPRYIRPLGLFAINKVNKYDFSNNSTEVELTKL